MTDAEALDLAVARTGCRRFRQLLDPSHPAHDPRYWATVRAIAARPDDAPRPVGAAPSFTAIAGTTRFPLPTIRRLKPLALVCLYALSDTFRSCGCRGCAWRGEVSLRDCLECTAALVRLTPGQP